MLNMKIGHIIDHIPSADEGRDVRKTRISDSQNASKQKVRCGDMAKG